MAYPAFEAVRPSPTSTSRGKSSAQRIGGLVILLVTSAVALSLTFSQSAEHIDHSKAEAKLFEEPSISLGIREHEALFHHAPVHQSLQAAQHTPTEEIKPEPTGQQVVQVAMATPTKAVETLRSTTSLGDYVDISHPSKDRWNYQLDSTATWPPHDNDDIPTGAYAKAYKGPYDPDYDWPDDTQVVRNDEWDKSGGVGCGMYGNSC